LVNTDELDYALMKAERRVLEIQTKLHRWSGDDPHRRFDDLYNLVTDPSFLLVAWDRVRSNRGARTAGVDGETAYYIEAGRGVEGFLMDLREPISRPVPSSHCRCGGGRFPRQAARFATWGSRRRRHTAASSSDDLGSLVVTHPFHPLRGQRLEVLFVKGRGGDTVFVCSGGVGGQITLPRAWTDRGGSPQAHRLSAVGFGRA
jgi:hypothetical protein